MKKTIIALAQTLGIYDRLVSQKATNADVAKFSAALKKEHNLTLAQALEALNGADEDDATQASAAQTVISAEDMSALSAAMSAINATLPANASAATAEATPASQQATPETQAASTGSQASSPEIAQLTAGVNKLVGVVQTLSALPESGKPALVNAAKPTIMLCGPGTTKSHLFGIDNEMFSLKKRWNVAAASREVPKGSYTASEKEALHNEFNAYGEDVRARFQQLHSNGQLPVMLAGNLDYTALESNLGAYYQTRRQDAIITYIMSLPTVPFPVRYGVQDEEVIVDAFFGRSFSQAYQSGRVFAGGAKFDNDKAKVNDVMFKYKFSDLKDLEKQYIGYLNREGSDPMKWSFIEWILAQCAVIQNNEKQERRIKGVAIESTATKPAYYMYASTGALTMLMTRSLVNPSVYAFDDLNKPDITGANYVEYVRALVTRVHLLRGKVSDLVLCMNDIYVPMFLESYREKYKGDNNYTGEQMEVKNFPLPKIVRIPNMGANKFNMWLMPEGSIEIHEDAPGEYYAYYFQRDMEELMVASYCKEGTFAFAGRRYANKADMITSKGRNTRIFANMPATVLAAAATTFDAFDNTDVKTVNNVAATAITNVVNAAEGELYTVICGGVTNATTIAKAAKFANLTAAWVPTVVGNFIRFIYNPTTDTFLEYDRLVGTTYTKNAALKAPEYVEGTI